MGNYNNNHHKKKRSNKDSSEDAKNKKKKKENNDTKKTLPGIPEFLLKNIDFSDLNYISDSDINKEQQQSDNNNEDTDNETDNEEEERLKLIYSDCTSSNSDVKQQNYFHNETTYEERQKAFQLRYKMEIARQNALLFGNNNNSNTSSSNSDVAVAASSC